METPLLRQLAPGLAKTCADYVARERAEAVALVERGEGGPPVATRLARAYDGLLSTLWHAAQASMRRCGHEARAALVALGGYGRGRLALHSDVDLVVLAEPGDSSARQIAEEILYPLWDAGIDVGHAVRTVEETVSLAEADLKTATTLLDARRIGGDERLVDALRERAGAALGGPRLASFLDRLRADAASRHERLGGELHLLEPEVKSGRGGLRDLDVALWAARIARRAERLADMPRVGLLSQREWEGVAAADDFLWRVRNLLHARAGRRSDRLTFEDQAEIADRMGFGAHEAIAAPAFMQTYYRSAEAVARASTLVLERCEPAERRATPVERDLGSGLKLHGEAVSVVDAGAFRADPVALVRLFRVAAERSAPIYPFARDLAAREASDPEVAAALRASPEAAGELLALLAAAAARPSGSALGEMHGAGVLAALLPEVAPLTGLVQHDLYHVYTVDVHSIRAVARFAEIRRGEWGSRLPLASRLSREVGRPGLVALAILLHDVGKGRGKDHSTKGAELAADVGLRLGLSTPDLADLVFLVREHLALYRAAMQRDTEDPALAAEVERRVGSVERLVMLYLLTLSDLGTTGPTVLTDWKVSMLDELFRKVRDRFEGRASGRRGEVVRESVLAAWPGRIDAEARAILAALPEEYLARHDVGTVLRHVGAIAGAQRGVRVRAWPAGQGDDAAEVLVSAPDRPGLLALVACALTANRLEVGSAGIWSRSDDVALDVFRVWGAEGLDARLDALVPRLERDLEDLVHDRVRPDALLASRRPPPTLRAHRLPPVPTKVEVDNRASDVYTVVDVYTRDRPGVLFEIARALTDLDLAVARARVATEGHRVADSFYVRAIGGAKVEDPVRIGALRARLVAVLEGR